MNKKLLVITLAVLLFSCSLNSDNLKTSNEFTIGQCIQTDWGQCTLTETDGNTYLFLQVTDWPEGEILVVPGIKIKVQDIFLKAKPKYHFAWRFYNGDLQIHTASFKGSEETNILVVKTKGKIKINKAKSKT